MVAPRYPDFTATQYKIEGRGSLPGDEASAVTRYYRDDEHLRFEGLLPTHGLSTVVFDPSSKTAYRMETESRARRMFAGSPAQPVATVLSEGETPQPLEVAWAALGAANARSLGGCRVAGERGRLWQPREPLAPDVQRTACITRDGIVLKLMENEQVLFEATSVERGPQPGSLFEIPETYRIVDDAELAEGDPAAEADDPGG